ncbi:MAG: RNA-binding protein [Candidatus Ventricola sp.]
MEDIQKALENAAKLAGEKGLIRFTRFLDPAEAELSRRLARQYGAKLSVWGGYDQAERVVGCFSPVSEEIGTDQYPVVCLHSRYSAKFCSVSHRDLLGSFMALGLTRSCAGDMIIAGADIYLFAHAQTADFIAQSMKSAGRTPLDFCALTETPQMPEPEGTRFSAVVSSLRLDGVLAAAYKLSRGEAAESIRAGLVKVDHLACDRVDAPLKEGALLSLRGRGRVRLVSVDGMTRKQRIGITLFRYE